jgi:hypothetical protein
MYAIVESGSITKQFNHPKKLTINNVQYSSKIFSLWTVAEKKAIGIYEVEYNNTNKKDEEWYINTNQTLAYDASGDKVTASYGTATAKKIADTLWTEQDKTDGVIRDGEDVGDVATEGLKTVKKRMIDNQCAGILAPSDWMVVKATETGTTMNSGWKTWRASVRTKCNSMQTQITNASDVDALATLFTYTEQEDGSVTRPLGEFPIKE